MRWAHLIVPDSLLYRVGTLKEALGYKANWKVLEKALDALEKEIKGNREVFIREFWLLLFRQGFHANEIPTNVMALAGFVYDLIGTNFLTEEEKNEIVARMIEVGMELKRERMKEHIAEEMKEGEVTGRGDSVFSDGL